MRNLLLILILFFISCAYIENKEQKAFILFEAQYKDNGYFRICKFSNFKVIRTIDNGNLTLEYRTDTSTLNKDKQSIIFIKNKNGNGYIIPFFSNSFKQYWKFENEKVAEKTPKSDGSFYAELNNCINTLGLNDSLSSSWTLIDEIFNHLLNCRKLNGSDDALSLPICWNTNTSNTFGEDNFYEIRKKVELNLNMIKQNMKNGSEFYYDEDNCRVYEIKYLNLNWRHNPCKFEIRTYRYDELSKEINL